MTTTVEATFHDDLILPIDDEVREWLAGFDSAAGGHLAVRDGRIAYPCDGRPARLGPGFPGRPCPPLPEALAERAALFFVAACDLPSFPTGFSQAVSAEVRGDPEALASQRGRFARKAAAAIEHHFATDGAERGDRT